MMPIDKTFTTKEKALQLNLDPTIYGTIAEIGGGQEVAGHFFKAGAASNTIAKTMSAYDMTFSDAIYGKCGRYVSQEKLNKMLEREYSLLDQRLTMRAKRTRFFAYANTVETINYTRSNDGHGWMGIRFQKHLMTKFNECIIHVSLKDNDAEWQQQVLGIMGVNLIHSCFSYSTAEEIIAGLANNIRKDRFEIDYFSIVGPDFHHVDNRIMTLKLVKMGLTRAAMFGPDKSVVLPSNHLYKKNTLVLRGRFKPVTLVNVDMMLSGLRAFKKTLDKDENKIALVELTLSDLTQEGEVDERDYLDRVDLLCMLGQYVMITNYQEHYKLAGYLSQFVKNKTLGIIIGYNNLVQIFDEKYYESLSGGIMEAFSRLFGTNLKLFVYPTLDDSKNKILTSEDFNPPEHLQNLHGYFKDNGKIVCIKEANVKHLHIFSDDVLKMIQSDSGDWETMVPRKVVDIIKRDHLFNYPAEIPLDEEDY